MKNAYRGILLSVGLTLSLLTACSGGISAAPISFDVSLNPNPLGFTAIPNTVNGTATYTIPLHTLTFASSAGAVGVTLEGYEIEFFEASQNPAFPGDSVQRSSSSLNIYVPPGLSCPSDEAEEEGGEEGEGDAAETSSIEDCTINTPGVTFERGTTVTSQPSTFIPIDIAASLYELVGTGGAVGAHANITFYGTDDLQRPFESAPYQFAISIATGGV